MKKYFLIFLIVISFILISCSLDRSNPLDPLGNPDVFIPPDIKFANVDETQHFPDYELKWFVGKYTNALYDTVKADGYFIYAAMNYYSNYILVDIKNSFTDTTKNIYELYSDPGYRWFKVSSYIFYPEYSDTLEGHYSIPVGPN